MDFQLALTPVVTWMCLVCSLFFFGNVGKWVAVALMLFTVVGFAVAQPAPGLPAPSASTPALPRYVEPLPQSGCIVMAGRCSCVVDGRLSSSASCPATVRPISLSGVFIHAEPPAPHVPFPAFGPAPFPKSEPARLGRFWVN